MSRFAGFVARLRSILRPGSAERRAEEEFTFHVEMEAARLSAGGTPPADARRLALARFGGVDRYRQEMREGRRANWILDAGADLRFGLRMLRKHKGVTAVAMVSLAIGIGANVAIFSLVNALLLSPRGHAQPEELVQVYSGHRAQPWQTSSYPSYLDFRERNTVFRGLASYGLGWQFTLGQPGEVQAVWGEVVSGNYFEVLGVRPWLGRMFLPEEDSVPGRNPVVVLGHSLWQRRYASDSTIVGSVLSINSQSLTVVGVAPPSFTGMMAGWATEIWVPAMMIPVLDRTKGPPLLASRGSKWVTMVGRLRPGVSLAQARQQFASMTAVLRADHPEEWTDRFDDGTVRESFVSLLPERATRVHPTLRLPVRALIAVLFVVVNLVLAIACMNLAGLLFARAASRRGEIAVRLALGAARFRVVRQLLTESVLLSILAGAAGLLVAFWTLDTILAALPVLPEGIRIAVDVRLEWRVVGWTLLVATVTGVLFGLAPALHATRSALSAVLKDDAQASTAPARASRSRRLLIVLQVAASLTLLIASGLLSRSLDNVRPSRLGFESERVVVSPIALEEGMYDRATSQEFYRRLLEAMTAVPGVRAVSLIDAMPGGFLGRTRSSIGVEGYTPAPGERMEIDASVVGPSYFTTMSVPIVAGRDFDLRDREGAPCAAVVNEPFAHRYLGGLATAIGRSLTGFRGASGGTERACQVVGVVRDDRWQTLNDEKRPFFFVPVLQFEKYRMTLLVHANGEPAALIPAVRRIIQDLDPGLPVTDVATLATTFGAAVFPFRVLGLLVGACGALALLLAAIGIYGTVSQAVAQRRREMGIRIALGAGRSDIVRALVGQVMTVVAAGLGAGVVAGLALATLLANMPLDLPLLFGVGAFDVLTFAAMTLLLAGVAAFAAWLPASRATGIDPNATLRGL